MRHLLKHSIAFILLVTVCAAALHAQVRNNVLNQVGFDSQGKPMKKQGGNDTLQHRNPLEDSMTLTYHYYDSSAIHRLDSSINNFYTRYPVPDSYVDLGNFGTPARSLLFSPYMKPGFDAGFHAFDVYAYTVENSKFYQTTRPYSELAYLIGSKTEQFIQLQHTQNRNPDFNFAFDFKFINSSGDLKNQNTNDNSLRLTSNYISKYRRYGNFFIFINNKMRSSDNGGLQTQDELNTLNSGSSLGSVFQLPVKLGGNNTYQNVFFTSALTTGTAYDESILLFRQYYDLGQKDSIVKDTVTYRLFYPRIRFQHTIEYSKNSYSFHDNNPVDSLYRRFYNYILTNDTVRYTDVWQRLTNDVSVISFPEKKNLNQYLKLGAGIEMLTGKFDPYEKKYTNIYAEAEYRNRTRNQKWDVVANGQLYMAGPFTGDYSAYISLKRELSKKVGSLQVGFNDVNRTPSFVFRETISSFPSLPEGSFNKENIARLFADIWLPVAGLRLNGEYYVISNYAYFNSEFVATQQSGLFNLLHLGLEKKFALGKHFNWYTNVDVQQVAGSSPVHVPFFVTRNRLTFEGNYFKNLFLATGIELRYYTAYKADGYAPL
ncbi:MAG TPA: putative porin, partial [Chitinophagaceae bacterium]|nr:putative porin [Chitinophagaceae bacterium]